MTTGQLLTAAVLAGTSVTTSCGGETAESPRPRVAATFNLNTACDVSTTLVVVDGTNNEAGASLRQELAAAIKLTDWLPQVHGNIPCVWDDPVAPRPACPTPTVVAFATSDGDAELFTPKEDPRLILHGATTSRLQREAWRAALADALLGQAPDTDGGAAVLAASYRTARLLAGLREPATSREEEIVDSVGTTDFVVVIIATAHEDTSPAEVTDYVVSPSEQRNIIASFDDFLMPASEGSECGFRTSTTPRLQDWVESMGDATVSTWRAAEACVALAPVGLCSFGRFANMCLEQPLPLLSDGTAPCRLLVATPLESCPTDLGWLGVEDSAKLWPSIDSVGHETPLQRDGYPFTCEVRQLTGADLKACRGELECAGCGPGFCVTQVPEILGQCKLGRTAPRIVAPQNDDRALALYQFQCEP